MSVNFNRVRFEKSIGNREYKAQMKKFLFPSYEDYSEAYVKFLKSRFKRHLLSIKQIRRFRTWKYNRKTQYK